MSQTSDFDIGPLTWVKSEIDAALERARDSIQKALEGEDRREPLRFAQTHVHQASGALSVVGLDGVSQYADAIDKLLSHLVTAEGAPADHTLQLASRGVAVLSNYINELLAGAVHQPLRLYASFREIVEARGAEAPQASELFFPDLGVRPALAEARSIDPARAAHEIRVMRGRFEKGLLAWIRQPASPTGPEEMLKAVSHIAQQQALPATRAFWWASIGFFEGLAEGLIQADRPTHKLCRRIDMQMRRLIEGSQVVAERLVRDVLYFVASAKGETPHAKSVREAYRLDRLLPAADAHLSDTLRQPLALRLRETLEQAKEQWNRFIAGSAVALPQFAELHAELVARAAPMRTEQIDRLLSSMGALLGWLRTDPLRANESIAMEVATGLLVIEQANESPNADLQSLRKQVDVLSERYLARVNGLPLGELDEQVFGATSQRAHEKLLFNQLAREILTNLGQIEQTLDAFFRNPAHRDALPALTGPLKQIEGAFAVLGEMQAVQLVRENAARIVQLSGQDELPSQDLCNDIAHQLSALGFYVEALKTGPAKLQHFLDPESAKLPDAEVEAVTGTVEAQLARDTRETSELVDALKESPEDDFLRQQLVSSLEAIREDAQLVADTELEQQAKEAIASLKAGDVQTDKLSEALAAAAPTATPQRSAEADRLMQVSSEELDAELLEIFLEEAQEVMQTLREHRAIVGAEPHNTEALITVRRSYHTLKGSSRMVGLQDFSEAARHVELALNRWLQLEKDGSGEVLSLIDHGREVFDAWVAQLLAGGSPWRDAAALIDHATRLLNALDMPPDEPPPVGSRNEGSTNGNIQAAASGGTVSTPSGPQAGNVPLALDIDLGGEADEVESTAVQPEPFSFEQPSVTQEALIEASLSETTFDMDPFDLPELGQGPEEFEASLEVTRLDGPLMDSLELDVPPLQLTAHQTEVLPDISLEIEEPVEQLDTDGIDGENGLSELDLTSSLLGSDIARLSDDSESEIDLTDTAVDPQMFGGIGEAGSETSLDIPIFELPAPTEEDAPRTESLMEVGEEDVPNLVDVVVETPPQQAPEAAAFMVADEPDAFAVFANEVEPAAKVEPEPEPEPESGPESGPYAEPEVPFAQRNDDFLQVVSIEDDDSDLELPHLNLNALGTGHAPDSMAERVAELVESSGASIVAEDDRVGDGSDITLGDQTLSRGLFGLFLNESRQHIDRLIEEMTHLRANPLRVPEAEAVRAAHTLAGISGTARVAPMQSLAKALEHALHHFCDAQSAPESAHSALMGTAVVTLDSMVTEVERLSMPLEVPELVEQLDALRLAPMDPIAAPAMQRFADLPDAQQQEAPAAAVPYPEMEVAAEEEVTGIQDDLDEQLLPIFYEEADELTAQIGTVLRSLRADANDDNALKSLARHLHTLKGSARMAGAMRLGEHIHELETRLEGALFAQQAGPALVDELESGIDTVGSLLHALRNPPAPAPAVIDEGEDEVTLADSPASPPPAGPEQPPAAQAVLASAADEAESAQATRATLRVRADLIDRFVNEAGEISIARTRIEGEMRTLRRSLLDLTENVIRLRNQLREVEIQAESQMQSRIAAAESLHANFDPLEFDRFTRLQELTRMMAESVGDVTTIQQNLLRNLDASDAALHAQGRLSRDMQQALMSVRMVPFDDLADRLHRVVRQTAKELGKRANLDIRGGRIEIDRGILDRMTAPIEHLLRNSIAHGIESPERRLAAGKPEFGQITITLNQRSNEIALEMTDDGAGLNFERILARGREAGLVSPDEQPSENRLTQLIFEPGFSTAESVSGIAGRGVGMDVVKNETLSVGGRIDVSSVAGEGAKFLVHLPLTLAVTQALLIRAGGRTYALPSNMVEQALELKEGPLTQMRERGVAEWKGQQYPFRYLPRLLGDTATQPEQGRYHWVMLLRAGNGTLALHIDELRGNQEIVVKNAGPQFVRLQGYTGATVLPDGEIALILNPVVLAGRQRVEEQDESDFSAPAADTFEVPTVMVVDDSLTVRKITSRLLEREGYRVVTAKDGVDALEQLGEMKPDVALLDIEMPRMDGFDLARNIRADDKLRDLPLIMITSRMADKHRNYAMEIGVNHYLGKPYQEEQLLELIAGFIAAKRAAR